MKPLMALMLCACLSTVYAASSFDSLPNSTLVNFRIPDGTAAMDAMKKTKIFALLNSADRWKKIREFINAQNPDGLDQFETAIAAFNLTTDDIPKVFSGETGIACALHPPETDGDEPKFTVFVYFEPEADLAQRLDQALEQAIEMDQAGKAKIQRNDYKAGDHEVMELAFERDEAYVLLNRHESEFLMAITDKRSLEDSKTAFVNFLDAKAGDGDEAGYAKEVFSTPGLSDGIPSGTNIMEFTYNPAVIVELLPEDEMDTPNMPGAEVVETLGLHAFKPGILTGVIDGNKMKQYAFGGMENPRTGVTRLFELPSIEAGPASWVPSTVPGYSHVSVDLGHVYDVVTDIAGAIGGAEAQMQIQQVNQMPTLFIGTDLKTFLGNFGKRIALLDFGKKRPEGAENAPMDSFSDRIGIVWDMNDTTALRQAMPLLQQQAAQMGGKPVNEQGATGVRIDMSAMQPGLQGGVFVTDGQFILAVGAGVAEEILKSLQNPPAGADSLAASEIYKTASTLMEPKKGFTWGVQDTNTLMKAVVSIASKDIENMVMMNPDLAIVQALMPSADEVEGVFGVSTNQGHINENGVVFEGVVELGLTE